jgi:hypothetical protein
MGSNTVSRFHRYMGGFTRPRDLRVTNWMPGGAYIQKGKAYENPNSTAYTPHTVFLVQSRYSVNQTLGRANTPEYIVGFVTENKFKKYLRQINSGWAGDELLEIMDNACWPGISETTDLKRVKWWKSEEDPNSIRRAVLEGLDNGPGTTAKPVAPQSEEKRDEKNVKEVDAEDEEYDSDDDDLLADLARVEEAKQERKRKKAQLKKQGASAVAVSHFNTIPFNPTMILYEHKVKNVPAKLTTQQVSYISNKERLRHYTKYLSHLPTPDTKPVSTEDPGYDENLRDPTFVETVLAGTSYEYRKKYIPTLAEQPFWIPVLAITLPTRPLARTVARLAKALPRGLPYLASIPQEDYKCRSSLPSRMLNLRLVRMRRLAMQTAERLAGYFGGFPGLRFDPSMPGRGVNGAMLDAPTTQEQRRAIALVANWYSRSQDEVDAYKTEGRISIPAGLMDERGNSLDPSLAVEEDTKGGLVSLPDQNDDDDSDSEDD